MSDTALVLDRLGRSLAIPERGVVGLVDELLAVALEHPVRLAWRAGSCQVSLPGERISDWIDSPVAKSVFRAALARIAALCNDRIPDSVSPYRGEGELAVDSDPSKLVRVRFVNTPEQLTLDLASPGFEILPECRGDVRAAVIPGR